MMLGPTGSSLHSRLLSGGGVAGDFIRMPSTLSAPKYPAPEVAGLLRRVQELLGVVGLLGGGVSGTFADLLTSSSAYLASRVKAAEGSR